MNRNQTNERLEELSYLWTSGEWVLHAHHQSSARVVFEFPGGSPTTSEFIAVRALLPKFRDSPVAVLKEEIGSKPEYTAGDFGGIEARRLAEAAKGRGLKARLEHTSRTGYLAVNRNGHALIIEDDELAELAHNEMRARGVKVVSCVEAD